MVVLFTDAQVLQDVRRIVGDAGYVPTDPKELCNLLLTTCYMGSENSSSETRQRSEELASQIGRLYDVYGIFKIRVIEGDNLRKLRT